MIRPACHNSVREKRILLKTEEGEDVARLGPLSAGRKKFLVFSEERNYSLTGVGHCSWRWED